jgi:hypothetical protein
MRDAYDYIASRLSGLHSRIKACSTRSLSAVKLTHGELAIYVRLAYWVAFGKDGVSLLWISRTVRTLNMECVLNSESQQIDVFVYAGMGSDELPRCCFVCVESGETVHVKYASLNFTSLYSVLTVWLSSFWLIFICSFGNIKCSARIETWQGLKCKFLQTRFCIVDLLSRNFICIDVLFQ